MYIYTKCSIWTIVLLVHCVAMIDTCRCIRACYIHAHVCVHVLYNRSVDFICMHYIYNLSLERIVWD